MKIALDTNILAYAEGVNGAERRDSVLALLSRLPREQVVVPAQTLGELFNVLVRKAGKSRKHARAALIEWSDAFEIADTSLQTMQEAACLATDHRLGMWDAVVLAASSKAGCRLLLSEDFQEGFTWSGVTVVNPFASPPHALLKASLARG